VPGQDQHDASTRHGPEPHASLLRRVSLAPSTPLVTARRTQLHRRLGRKAAIVNHQVLDVATALCAAGAYDVARAMYEALRGDPPAEYEGCVLGVLVDLRGFMGEDPEPIGETLVIRF
jgi:hypothetical protein